MNCQCVSEETHTDKARGFIWKGCLGREQQREPRRIALPVAYSHAFYGDGIPFQVVSGQPFKLKALSGLAHTLLSQDGCQHGYWEVVGPVASPFNFFRILPVGGFLVRVPIPGLPVIK